MGWIDDPPLLFFQRKEIDAFGGGLGNYGLGTGCARWDWFFSGWNCPYLNFMSLLDSLERRFHWFAIPGLLRIIAGFQVATFILILMKPEAVDALTLDWGQIRAGQVWRLVSFCLIPSSQHVIWIIFATMILLWISDSLESAWGAFRVTVFFFGTVACLALGAFFSDRVAQVLLIPALTANFLYMSIFLAFALTYPRVQLNLWGILPVEARWLGCVDLVYLGYQFVIIPPLRLYILLMLVPLVLIAGPMFYRAMRQQGRVQVRRARMAADSLPVGEHFAKCSVCERTDLSDPELTFRIAADGEEYCLEHMPVAQK